MEYESLFMEDASRLKSSIKETISLNTNMFLIDFDDLIVYSYGFYYYHTLYFFKANNYYYMLQFLENVWFVYPVTRQQYFNIGTVKITNMATKLVGENPKDINKVYEPFLFSDIYNDYPMYLLLQYDDMTHNIFTRISNSRYEPYFKKGEPCNYPASFFKLYDEIKMIDKKVVDILEPYITKHISIKGVISIITTYYA